MKTTASRSAQCQQTAEFVWNYNNWVVDTVAGTKKTFGSSIANSVDPAEPNLTAGTAVTFDAINMPNGATINGGELICETAYVGIGAGATITIGTSASATNLLGSTDLDALTANTRTPLLLTSVFACNGGLPVRITTAGLTATATAGKFRLRVNYTIDGKADFPVPG